jgi:hypothetical protein
MLYVFIILLIIKQILCMAWVGADNSLLLFLHFYAVVAINQNVADADANAIKQSIAFQEQVFPVIFSMLRH